MNSAFQTHLQRQIDALEEQGLLKTERVITTPQRPFIEVQRGGQVLNFCANNYLGLASSPELVDAAHSGLDRYGYGMASVRFICGTQTVHQALETKLSEFLGMEAAILYSSCWDANGGLFETILGEEDAVISDALNHASIIDGIRLCKAQRYRYANNDMADLEKQLKAASNARFKLIATDGVFSMDGVIANLSGIVALAEQYNAMVMVDDSHAVGFIGANGKGTHEYCDVMGKVDILTGTLGKALGGASGGYVAASKEVVTLLRQRSRPYLFSNTLMPAIANATLTALELLETNKSWRKKVHDNSDYFRGEMRLLGFKLAGAGHPIIPVMLGDAKLASTFAQRMLAEGIYVIGFSYPVVPKGEARIRTQMSAAHTREQLDRAIAAFRTVGKELGVI